MPDLVQGFGVLIADASVSGLLGFAGSAVGIAQVLLPLLGIGGPDPTEQVLSRIDQLEQSLGAKLDSLGTLIQQQAGMVVTEMRSQKVHELVASARAAQSLLYDYAAGGRQNGALLANADQQSLLTVDYILDVGDVLYLPSLIIAGCVRLGVIKALKVDYYTDPNYVAEVRQLASALDALLTQVRQSVQAQHSVVTNQVLLEPNTPVRGPYQKPTRPSPGDYGHEYEHLFTPNPPSKNGQLVVAEYRYGANWGDPILAPYKDAPSAQAAAQTGMQAGIANELAFVHEPEYEGVLKVWQQFASPPH